MTENEWRRSHSCGELRATHEGQTVVLTGWVAARRDAGSGLTFLVVRDRAGITQAVLEQSEHPEAFAAAEEVRLEFVVAVRGTVRKREAKFVNPEMATGEIEVVAQDLQVLNRCEPLPFPISFAEKKAAGEASEEVRLANRYLDLRRPEMQQNLILRHRVCQAMRAVLNEQDYLEVETPILGKSTPEGARDYLVPARKYPGQFYALPQSPQQYKQMLQTAGVEKYYQIARCFRDEDQRGDRQPEFTQLDIEASFVDEEDIIALTERIVAQVAKEAKGIELTLPFKRMAYDEAMIRFGKDAPDLRFGMEIVELTEAAKGCEFKVFRSAAESGGAVRGLVAKNAAATYKRKQVEDWEKKLKSQYPKVKGLAWFALQNGEPSGGIAKFMQGDAGRPFVEGLGMEDGDVAFFLADEVDVVCDGLGTLRKWLGEHLGLIEPGQLEFLWIVDFPMFEYAEEEERWVARHHPFTQPKPEHLERLQSEPGKVKARAYDLVLNGTEIAGGSIRIHSREMQRTVFAALGIDEQEAEARFGHLLRALSLGTPPHGGIAFGLDRLVMILAGEETIRDVIPFPKTLQGKDLLMGAPDAVEPAQLEELHLLLSQEAAEANGEPNE